MTWQMMLQFVAAVGTLGWLVALLQYRSQNKKTLAEADKTQQELNRMMFDQMVDLLALKDSALTACEERLAAQDEPKRNSGGRF